MVVLARFHPYHIEARDPGIDRPQQRLDQIRLSLARRSHDDGVLQRLVPHSRIQVTDEDVWLDSEIEQRVQSTVGRDQVFTRFDLLREQGGITTSRGDEQGRLYGSRHGDGKSAVA